jgi:hypothetical protein
VHTERPWTCTAILVRQHREAVGRNYDKDFTEPEKIIDLLGSSVPELG